MPIFSIKKDDLKKVREVVFGNEKKIQNLTEKNLKNIFGLEFVKTETTPENRYSRI